MENKILVTGGSGNIGKEVVKLLSEKGANFKALVNTREIEGVETVSANYGDLASIEKAMEGVSTLFMVLQNHPEMEKRGQNIIEAAKKAGIKHIVRSSGSLADKNSPLLIRKLLGETDQVVMDSGIDYTITSPSFFMQNFINYFTEDYKNGAIYQPSADGKVSWTDVRDIAAVNVEVLLNPEKYKGQNLVITGSESFGYDESVKKMNDILGKESTYVAINDEAAIEAMKGQQFPDFVIDLMMSLNHCIVQGIAEETTNVVEEVTGKKPILFDQFIQDNKEIWS